MSSILGYLSLPGTSPNSMSKFAVRALGESLRGELVKDGVSVTNICPGFIDSEIFQVDNQGVYQNDRQANRPGQFVMPTHRAAKQIFRSLKVRSPESVITLHG